MCSNVSRQSSTVTPPRFTGRLHPPPFPPPSAPPLITLLGSLRLSFEGGAEGGSEVEEAARRDAFYEHWRMSVPMLMVPEEGRLWLVFKWEGQPHHALARFPSAAQDEPHVLADTGKEMQRMGPFSPICRTPFLPYPRI